MDLKIQGRKKVRSKTKCKLKSKEILTEIFSPQFNEFKRVTFESTSEMLNKFSLLRSELKFYERHDNAYFCVLIANRCYLNTLQ